MPEERRPPAIEIWCVDLAACAAALSELEARTPRLPPSYKGRPEERAAHIALRLLVERAFGAAMREVMFTRSASGRPSLPGIAGDFSLSHGAGLALIGIAARGPIGVDVEGPRPIRMAPPRRERLEAAGQMLNPSRPLPEDPQARFLQAWTRLEAVAKAGRRGMGSVLTAVGRPGAGQLEERVRSLLAAPPELAVHDLTLDRPVFAAAATPADIPAPPTRMLPASIAAFERLLAAEK